MSDDSDPIAEARARLQAERAEVLQELEQLNSRLETKGDYELGEGDPMIYQWELNLALRERAQQHLAEIDEALAAARHGHLRAVRAVRQADRAGTAGSPEPHDRLQPVCPTPALALNR